MAKRRRHPAVRGVSVAASIAISLSIACARRDASLQVQPLRDLAITGRFAEPDLVEASGVVASTRVAGVLWSQNDSGNDERVFAYDSTGRALGAVRVRGSNNRDWEAIAIGVCPQGSCLYIGDVGDNAARRDSVIIWRIPEPLPSDTISPQAERLYIRYQDGPRDVEAMYVAPDSSIMLISKRPDRDAAGRSRAARIYRITPTAWQQPRAIRAEIVDSLPITPLARDYKTWITDASLEGVRGNGARRLAVRTYNDVYIFSVDTLTWQPSALMAHCSLHALRDGSGEGVTWLADGRLLFNSEGSGARLQSGRCP